MTECKHVSAGGVCISNKANTKVIEKLLNDCGIRSNILFYVVQIQTL